MGDMTTTVVPSPPERIDQFVDHWITDRPDQEFLVGPDRRLTYAEARVEVDACTAALAAVGVARGDRVGYLGDATVDFFIHFLAATSLGAIWVGLNPKYQAEELAHVISDATPTMIFIAADTTSLDGALATPTVNEAYGSAVPTIDLRRSGLRSWVDATDGTTDVDSLRAAVEPTDGAFIVYTSGSTGRPKGAVLPHTGVNLSGVIGTIGRGFIDSRVICNLPINHVGAVSDICIRAMIGGGTIIMQDRFDPALMMRTVAEEQINLWGGVPTIFQICVAHPDFADADLSSVEHIAWGGAAMPFELIQQLLAKTGASRASTGYGSTETIGGVVFSGPDDSAELATTTVGFIADQTELRLVDDKGNDVAQGEQGEMLVRCDFLMKEYWNRPEATAAAIDSDGWYRTGDLLRQRDDGRYVFLGRNSDMFKSGGYNVYPREVEDCLEEHPAVAMAAVVGVPDELFQEVGHAHVVLSGDAAPDAIIEHVRSHLANYKVPKAVFVHEQLPMLAVGKVDKVALRATSAPGGQDG